MTAAKALLSNPAHFSRLILDMELYPYQLEPLKPIITSVLKRQGLEFLLVFPRQSGKNEAVAHLLVYLLNLFQRVGGSIVFGAIGDGLGRGIRRLEQRLDNPWNAGRWKASAKPTTRRLINASVIFLSTHPQAQARGETATWLLIIDELQEQNAPHLEAVFEPMRAANNATALFIGTVKTSHDALWLKRQALLAAEARDGIKRVFIVDPDRIMRENGSYRTFLEAKLAKFGRNHPTIASEYFNEPLDATGGLFDERRLKLMRGSHGRQDEPDLSRMYIATLDVAGPDEASTDPLAQLSNPGRDYTIATIFDIRLVDRQPHYLAVDVFVDHGSKHFQTAEGLPPLSDRLLAWLRHWQVQHLVGDGSGIGAGLLDWLSAEMGTDNVTPFLFTMRSKAKLGSMFLAAIETGRFKYWTCDLELPCSDSWWFFTQAKACTYHVPDDGQFDTHLQWFVPETAAINTPAGRELIHDDRLLSASLVSVFDDLYRQNKLRLGSAKSAVVAPVDPLEDLTW